MRLLIQVREGGREGGREGEREREDRIILEKNEVAGMLKI